MTFNIWPCMTDIHCFHLKRIFGGFLFQVAPPSHTPQLPPTTHHHSNPDYRWKQVSSSTFLSSPLFHLRPWKPLFSISFLSWVTRSNLSKAKNQTTFPWRTVHLLFFLVYILFRLYCSRWFSVGGAQLNYMMSHISVQ